MKITKDITIAEILRMYPLAAKLFAHIGMHCFACPASQMETLEEGVAVHGIDVDEIVDALNELFCSDN